jgi:mRNA-degrading endonuclease YafQ of YafQ-DinJ toxin-antitoxin module
MKRVPLEVHKTRRFDKQLQAMYKAGKNERNIAKLAEKIVNNLQADPLHEETECRRTHNGENRVKGCRKYNLSCGFRLVGLKRGKRLIFTCIGNHADCQQWIENHRKKQEKIESIPIPESHSENSQRQISPIRPEPEIDIYEEQLMAKIDEQILCEIFSGLCKKSEK